MAGAQGGCRGSATAGAGGTECPTEDEVEVDTVVTAEDPESMAATSCNGEVRKWKAATKP
jgi:hypothetical protein